MPVLQTHDVSITVLYTEENRKSLNPYFKMTKIYTYPEGGVCFAWLQVFG